jgi:hypothetical protein
VIFNFFYNTQRVNHLTRGLIRTELGLIYLNPFTFTDGLARPI